MVTMVTAVLQYVTIETIPTWIRFYYYPSFNLLKFAKFRQLSEISAMYYYFSSFRPLDPHFNSNNPLGWL